MHMYIVDLGNIHVPFSIKPDGLKRVEKLNQPNWRPSIISSEIT